MTDEVGADEGHPMVPRQVEQAAPFEERDRAERAEQDRDAGDPCPGGGEKDQCEGRVRACSGKGGPTG